VTLALLAAAAGLVGGLQSPHFDIQYTARAKGTAERLPEHLEAIQAELEALLGHPWPGRTEVRVGVGRAELNALSPEGAPPPWAAAVAFPDRHLIVLDALNVLSPDGEVTLRHELVHEALAELGGPWPRWFHEGLAMELSAGPPDLARYTTLVRAVAQDRVFHFADLATAWPAQPSDVEIAYAQSASFVGFLTDRHGPARFNALLEGVHRGEPFEMAFGKAFHSSLDAEERDWRATLPSRYSWLPLITGQATIWVLAALATVLGYLRRRGRRAAWNAAQVLEPQVDLEPPFPEPPPDDPMP
jgi:hypothetical protein